MNAWLQFCLTIHSLISGRLIGNQIQPHINYNTDEDRSLVLDFTNRLPLIIDKICLQEIDLEEIDKNFISKFPDYDNHHHAIWTKNSDKKVYKIGNITLWRRLMFKCSAKSGSCAIFTRLVHLERHLKVGERRCAADKALQIRSCLKKFKKTPTIICGVANDMRCLLARRFITFLIMWCRMT